MMALSRLFGSRGDSAVEFLDSAQHHFAEQVGAGTGHIDRGKSRGDAIAAKDLVAGEILADRQVKDADAGFVVEVVQGDVLYFALGDGVADVNDLDLAAIGVFKEALVDAVGFGCAVEDEDGFLGSDTAGTRGLRIRGAEI